MYAQRIKRTKTNFHALAPDLFSAVLTLSTPTLVPTKVLHAYGL